MQDLISLINSKLDGLNNFERNIVQNVWKNKELFIRWPKEGILFWPDCVRIKYHNYPIDLKNRLKSKGITVDSRSNGPAINAFMVADGIRPKRYSNPNREWSIHHIYDGKFPLKLGNKTLHAVKDGKHFTQSAGLVAIHPIADALADEYSFFAWMLRHEAYQKFKYDPDHVFSKEIDQEGFEKTV
ncbi:MAG: hypothetical protein IAX21_08350 [Candidatus Bathyarchaeota archaeon]|nr:MAG: hypothetical protein IAX21_08350 [Candidatus Bathyarchaeota archaeon]